jgi:accessory gene regulator B
MIEALANRMAITIKQANEDETTSIEVLRFGLIIVLNTAFIIISSLVVAWITGTVYEVIIVMTALIGLKFFSGGKHFRSSMICVLFSTFIITVIPHLDFFQDYVLWLNGANLLLVALFAPSNIENHTRIEKKYYPVLKMVSVFIVSTNFIISSYLLALAFFIQAISLIEFKRVRR